MMNWNVWEILSHAPTAILILNQPIACNSTFLISLWEKALIRIAVDGGANRWRSFLNQLPAGMKPPVRPHCVTGDFDSISDDTTAVLREWGVPFWPTPDQDESDYTKALRVVAEMETALGVKVEFVLCVCENTGRMDQIMANLESLHLANSWAVHWRPILVASDSLTWLLPTGRHSIQVPTSNVTSALPCGLIPLKGATTVSTRGLKWDLDNGVLEFGRLVSTSNTFVETTIQIETSNPLVWTTCISARDTCENIPPQ